MAVRDDGVDGTRKEAYETSISDPAKNAAGQVEKAKLRPLLKKIP